MNVSIKIPGLDNLIKALQSNLPDISVGILSDKRRDDGQSNALIGAAHEFGTSTLPQRSFLRVPLADHLSNELDDSGAFDESALEDILSNGNLDSWAEKIAIVAESIILKAFDTSGYGKWQESDMTHKKNQQTLVETGQLRNSISWEVK